MKKNQHLMIIDPATQHPELGCSQWIQKQWPHRSSVHYPGLHGISSLVDVDVQTIAGVVILGSGASPKDTSLPWQHELIQWLWTEYGVLKQKKPILGICYGHQLLAHLFGCDIHFLWQGNKAKGLRWTSLSGPHLNFPHAVPLVVSHREGFAQLPQGWYSLSPHKWMAFTHDQRTDIMPVQAIEAMRHHQYPWYGFQAHIEAVDEFLLNNHIAASLPQPYAGHQILLSFLRETQSA